MTSRSKFKPSTALAVIIANMIGTGVFTSLGFQLIGIQSGFVILMLWIIGGITALCGALTYAELGSALPRSGGEYNFLSHIYHPVAGFTSGWISSTIGFSAPTALAAITFGSYLSAVFPFLSAQYLALALLAVMTIVHGSSRKNSGQIQQIFTLLKIFLILVFCLAGLLLVAEPQPVNFMPIAGDKSLILSSTFAISLIYVSYAYTGWNAATYISSELEHPQKSLSTILLSGTVIVTICYVLLNYVFLYTAPIDELVGKVEIGVISAQHVFGDGGAMIMGTVLSLLLISTVSAMTLAGPRVLQVIGEDFKVFEKLAVTNADGVPTRAIYFQSSIAAIFVLTSSFESILVFSGFALALNSFLAVAGIFVLRYKQPELERPYKTWLYPLPPLIYLAVTGWTLSYILIERQKEAGMSLGIIALGIIFYYFTTRSTLPTSK
ncbi:MAG: amino acid permease [Gammaproteobacteria bacterium]|nr:MAG: amino acid permease [Gammaproteobacteria bacterium]